MKKTKQTLATAAMFAAAAVSSLSVSAQESELMAKTAQPTAVLYGPPWVFAEKGDMNYDHSFDARDVSLLKQVILEERSPKQSDEFLGDVNLDGAIDKDDVKELIRQLTGKPEDEEEQTQTTDTTGVTDTTITTLTTTETEYPVSLYGPTRAWN